MTDEMIIGLYFDRNEKAIEETDKAYGRYFRYIARGILNSDEDSREVVNDTYMKAWNTIPPERPVALKAFLGRITRQLSINRLEQNNAQKRGGGQYFLALDELKECVSDNNPTDAAESVALQEALNKFLRSLSPDARRVFIRRYWHTHSVSEIAKDLRMSESKVKSMLMRTREKLKKHLEKEGFNV